MDFKVGRGNKEIKRSIRILILKNRFEIWYEENLSHRTEYWLLF